MVAAFAALAAVVDAQTLVQCALDPKAQDEFVGIQRCAHENTSDAAEIRRAGRLLERKVLTRSGMRIVKLDAASIEAMLRSSAPKSEPIRLPLVGDLLITLSGGLPVDTRSPGVRQWRGNATLEGDGVAIKGTAFLAWSSAGIEGTFELGSRLFRFQQVWRDYYGLYETERAVLPVDHPVVAALAAAPQRPGDDTPPFDDLNPPKTIAVSQGGLVDMVRPLALDNGIIVVALGIGFTKTAADAIVGEDKVGDERSALLRIWAHHQVDRANAIFETSGTMVKFVLADPLRDVRDTGIVERARAHPSAEASKWFDLEMAWYMHPATSPAATDALCHWHATRANVYVLVGWFGGDLIAGADPSGRPLIEGACGWSGKPHGIVDPAAPATFEKLLSDPVQGAGAAGVLAPGRLGYSVVKQLCVEHHFTLAHELGHLFGATHERASFSNPLEFAVRVVEGEANLAFGFGHIEGSGGSRRLTVMSVGTRQADRLDRIGEFSRSSADPGALGAPDADNARLIRLVAPFVARRTPPVPSAGTCSR